MRLVTIKNPFDPNKDRVTEIIQIEDGLTVEKLAQERTVQNTELRVSVNGQVREGHYLIKKNDFVVISPIVAKGGGKKIFAMVAMIALAVVAPQIGVAAMGGTWGGTIAASTGLASVFGAYAISAAVMFLGGMLISRFTSTQADVGSYDSTTDPTYSWNGTTVMEGQNNAVQVIYGKVKTSGQSIGKYISTLDNKEYLNWLICLGEGPLTISNILINDNAASYYSGLTIETRSGTNDQTVINNFNDTYYTDTLGYLLTTTERIQAVQGNATQGIIVKIEFSNGLYYAKDDGSLSEAWVTIECDYRLVGATAWTNLVTPNTKISGNVSSAIRREFRVDGLASGSYEVRLYVTGRSHAEDNTRASVKCYWTGLTSIIYDDFAYPNKALLAIKAMATDQLNGSPNVSCIVERSTVWVWNPNTSAYEEKAANNPAWACYDYIHQAHRLMNINTSAYEFEVRGAPAELMIYDQFSEWAAFCDSKNLKINWIDNTVGKLMEKINQKMAPIGRGYVLWFGTRCGCIWDSVKEPVQMFGMGNIISGTFKEEFLPTSDRANCIELTYTDANANYERQTVTIYGDDYDTAEQANTTQITYDGITSYDQAVRTAKYLLYCNKYLVRTVSFEADIDAISCTIGDVILVSHDVPKWARSGRIAKVDGVNLTLYCEDLTDTTSSYRIMYRTQDDVLHEKNVSISSSSGGTTIVYITAGFSDGETPQVNDVFDLALVSKGSKPFSVRSITRAQDFTRKIEAIEYNANIYSENYDVPPIQYSDTSYLPTNVQQLQAHQIAYKNSSGTMKCVMQASWVLPQGAQPCKYTVLLSKDNVTFSIVKSNISSTSIEIDTELDTQYWIKVVSILGVNQSTGTVTGPISKGVDSVPPDVTALRHELLADGTRRFWWDFVYPDPNDIAGFRIKYVPNGIGGWDSAIAMNNGVITSQPFETAMLRQGMATVLIKAVDNLGQESANAAMLSINLGDVLQENVLYSKNLEENNWASVVTDGYIDTSTGYLMSQESAAMWSTAGNPMWSAAANPMWSTNYSAFTASFSFTAIASGNLWIDLDITGPVKVTYTVNGQEYPYTQKVTVKVGDILKVVLTGFAGATQCIIRKAVIYIDVPDKVEHFNSLAVPVDGLTLPIKTPNYYTTAVRLDAIENNAIVWPQIVTRNPCVIKLYNSSGTYVAGTVDVTWQGFIKEV